MTAASILLVEDDTALRDLLEYRLRKEGFGVRSTGDGDEALLLVREALPDLIVLDWMIENTSGIEVCRQVRRSKTAAKVPIIMLTARATEDDRVRGLETGADDYLVKPFSPRELVLRVNAVLRRTRPVLADEPLRAGELTLDPVAHRVQYRDRDIALGPTEFRLLQFLMESPSRVFERGQLLDQVWGTERDIAPRTVDVHVRRLRKAVMDAGAPDPVRTVRGSGYALTA